MKKYLIIGAIFFVLFLGTLGALIAPYAFYQFIIEGSYSPEWFKINKIVKVNNLDPVLDQSDFVLHQTVFEDYTKNLNVFAYNIPLPMRHPIFEIFPIVEMRKKSKEAEIGIDYTDHEKNKILTIMLHASKTFKRYLDDQKLFKIPLVRSTFKDMQFHDFWKDLFTKEVISFEKINFFDLSFFDGSYYKEMVYDLYLLHMRDKIFEEMPSRLYFFEEKNLGMAHYPSSRSNSMNNEIKEQFFQVLDLRLESFTLYYEDNNLNSKDIRALILKNIRYDYSSPKMGSDIFKEFKMLSYEDKLSEVGFNFLFAAWSHDLKNKKFLRDVLAFLERSPDNLTILGPLYNYAFDQFGESLKSEEGGDLSSSDFLKQKIEDENKKEIRDMVNSERKKFEEMKFENSDEKVKYFLEKAKQEAAHKREQDGVDVSK